MDLDQIAMCGDYCGECAYREPFDCPGCQAACGDMVWGTCAVAKCCVSRGYRHCGQCPELPCATLQAAFDHPEHGDGGERLRNLRAWAAGDMSYIKPVPPAARVAPAATAP